MSEYLSPGVYIEEFEMGAKPIEGVSTSTVGFVGAASNLVEDVSEVANKTTAAANNADSTVKLHVVKVSEKLTFIYNKLKTGKEDEAKAAFEDLKDELKKAVDAAAALTDQTKIEKAAAAIKAGQKALKIAAAQFYADTPIFVSSWADFVSKYGLYSSKAPYLAPALYSFFANGGKRCYVVAVRENADSALKGKDEGPGKRTGLEALKEVDEVSILVVPGAVSKTVQQAMISQCEILKDRFCILDSAEEADMSAVKSQREGLTSDKGYGALYYPWLKSDVEIEKNGKVELESMYIPPSGAVAGIYARSDTERGVHKAPANEVVRSVTQLKYSLTDAEQDILNPKGINCIRAFSGRGIRVWGARTISSDSSWKYVNIRRLFIYLEESIEEATQWVVFEPNDERLWARVKQTIENFLNRVWRDGALMGNTPEEAYFVRCDRTTMTQDDIDNGRLVVVIGVAPVKPAEFVIFRIAQWTANAKS